MAIDAIISKAVVRRKTGTVKLLLEPRERGGTPGQRALIVLNPPKNLTAFCRGVIGTQIWGSSGMIMVGETEWAKRVNYTEIMLNNGKGKK